MIREATETDTPRLVDMARDFLHYTPYGRLLAPTHAQLVAFVETIRTLGVILVWEGGIEIEGMIGLVCLPHPVDGTLIAEEIAWWVSTDLRGSHIGPSLLTAAEAWSRQKCARAIKMVAPASSRVGRFLTHQGYAPIETAFYKELLDEHGGLHDHGTDWARRRRGSRRE